MCGGTASSGDAPTETRRQGVPPRADVAEVLLNDVKLRLAGQLNRTVEMTKDAEAVLSISDDGRSSRQEQSDPKQKPKTEQEPRPGLELGPEPESEPNVNLIPPTNP